MTGGGRAADLVNLVTRLQPIYKIGARRSIKTLKLTVVDWQVEMFGVTPA